MVSEKQVSISLNRTGPPGADLQSQEKSLVYRDSSSKQGPGMCPSWNLGFALWSPSSGLSHSPCAMHTALVGAGHKVSVPEMSLTVYSYLQKFGVLKFAPYFVLPLNLSVQNNRIPLNFILFNFTLHWAKATLTGVLRVSLSLLR